MSNEKKLEIEEKVLRYFQNKEIISERKEENKMLQEEIEEWFEESGEDELVFQLPNGEYAVLKKKAKVREVLDKDALANAMLVVKNELRTPFDYSMFTKQGKLSPDLISKYTTTETDVTVRISKRKTKPRTRKK